MSNRIKCALCLEHFEDPRILGCFHTFCYQCLQRYLATSLNPQRFSCPVCRSVNTLPKEGVAGLQKNFYVNEDSAKPRHPMCSSHPSEDLRFYCKTCDVAVCRDCKVISHTIHETDMIDNVTNKIKQTIEQTLIHADHTIQDSWVQARELLRREECMLNDVVTTLNRTTREIKSEADHLARVVGMRLNQNFINNRNNMTTVNNLLQMRKVSIDRYRTMLSDTLSKSNSYKVLEMYKSSFRTEEFKQLGRAPSAYEQLKEQTLSKDDIASYKEMLTKMFDNIRGKMRELQGLVPHLTRNVGTAQKTHISLCTQR